MEHVGSNICSLKEAMIFESHLVTKPHTIAWAGACCRTMWSPNTLDSRKGGGTGGGGWDHTPKYKQNRVGYISSTFENLKRLSELQGGQKYHLCMDKKLSLYHNCIKTNHNSILAVKSLYLVLTCWQQHRQ